MSEFLNDPIWDHPVLKEMREHWRQLCREYEVHAYARRWKGPGKDFKELAHNEHPIQEEIATLVLMRLR